MLCKCGKKAIYFRRYSGQKFCEEHFIEYFENKVKKTIINKKMLKSNDRVGVALSGGKDSAVALYLLNKFRKEFKIEIKAISIDEGIKNYRERTLKLAKELCRSLGVEHFIVPFKEEFGKTLDEMPGPKCSYCGVFRRRLLNQTARELKLSKLATGHNLDDVAQAILMNYIRGDIERLIRLFSPLKYEQFIPKVRPLMEMPEEEVALFAIVNKLPVSLEECPYRKQAFRLRIRNFINELEKDNPGIRFSILRGYEKILPIIREYPRAKLKRCKLCGEPTSQEICKACKMLNEIVKY